MRLGGLLALCVLLLLCVDLSQGKAKKTKKGKADATRVKTKKKSGSAKRQRGAAAGIPAHLLGGSGGSSSAEQSGAPSPGPQERSPFAADDPVGAHETELTAKSERAIQFCNQISEHHWGQAEVRAEARAVMEDLDAYHEGQLGNLRCLATLYELLGEHVKLVKAMAWQLDQPWCCPTEALDPPGSKIPCRCFAVTLSTHIQALLALGQTDEAQKLFDRAVGFEIGGRKAVHWHELTQLAPYTVAGLTARAMWEPAAEHFPLARLMESEHRLFEQDLQAVVSSGMEWGYSGITPEIIGSGNWTSFPLLQNMEWNEAHCAVAANICRLLRDRVELMGDPPRYVGDDTNKNTSVMLAKLSPGTHLRAHTGGHNTQLSLHLVSQAYAPLLVISSNVEGSTMSLTLTSSCSPIPAAFLVSDNERLVLRLVAYILFAFVGPVWPGRCSYLGWLGGLDALDARSCQGV